MKAVIENLVSRKFGNQTIPAEQNFQFEKSVFLSTFHHLKPEPRRQFHAFCIGLPRSGTHSLSYIFEDHYRAEHEPLRPELIVNLVDFINGRHSKEKMRNILRYRDKRLQLDLESCHFLHHVIEILVPLFPEAKFILTVREPMSWLASEINQNYHTRNNRFCTVIESLRYCKHGFSQDCDALQALPNVYPIPSYLTYWKEHISRMLSCVPPERLLILDTFQISEEIRSIADFLDVPEETLNPGKMWSGQRKKDHIQLYDLVDRERVLADVLKYCGDFIEENLPFMTKYLAFSTSFIDSASTETDEHYA
ncbi:MAG: sulfotransferase domain-containing protein [Leptolyngbyaceae cyanobacterium T60_A2020_046]|nr:sulfotransferase domain-containing protein [Leptolyngbyaceae cyanobacterium T60_A2020_046]